MIISRNWLNEFIEINTDTNSICEKLTSLGLEVEGITKAAPDFSGVVVGEVINLSPHPDADKLQVAEVNIGQDANLQIVCGAKNIFSGGFFPVATIDAELPGNFKIKKTKLRGVESFGMLCSAKELGISEDSNGLLELDNTSVVGDSIRSALNLDDELIEIGLTPNRGDCLSMLGVARELAAGFGCDLKTPFPEVSFSEIDDLSPSIKLMANEACPKYISRKIVGVNNKVNSPLWMQEKLRRAGIRNVSAIVDITNYVMLELGVPMHSFDFDKITGDINVRLANNNESITLLDGRDVKLDDDILVISDENKPIAIAGIMGSEGSSVDTNTDKVVLESAWFNRSFIMGRAKRFAISTDASYRFERGVDYKLQEEAIDRVTDLIIKICGGEAAKLSVAVVESYLPKSTPVQLTHKKIDSLLGVRFPKRQITPFLTSLGMIVAEVEKGVYDVICPSHRFDITCEEDLIEELIRLWGYDNVPINPVAIQKLDKQRNNYNNTNEEGVHSILNNIGYNEAICYSFIDEKTSKLLSEHTNVVPLLNPISEELKVMRTSLVPSLIKTLVYNVNRQQKNIRLYEVGSSYQIDNTKITETKKLSGVSYGLINPIQWGFRDRGYDFFDIKGDLEIIFDKLDIYNQISYERADYHFLHPRQAANILYQGSPIGFIGTIHPSIQASLGLDHKAYAFEIDLDKLMIEKKTKAKDIGKYPMIRRDISILVAQSVPVQDIVESINNNTGDLVRRVELFDVYVGRNIPRDTKSLAIAIFLQDNSKTLEDEYADEVIGKAMDCLKRKFNAQLRG